jgi:hypothetical protein
MCKWEPVAGGGCPSTPDSVAVDLDQPLVADAEVMGDLVQHDVPNLVA